VLYDRLVVRGRNKKETKKKQKRNKKVPIIAVFTSF
jgi:hypothetical protein